MSDTWNTSLTIVNGASPVFSNSDRTATATANGITYAQTLTSKSSGKWYAEITMNFSSYSDSTRIGISFFNNTVIAGSTLGDNNRSISWSSTGNIQADDYVASTTPYNNNDVIGIACDFDRNRIWFRTNNNLWTDQENYDGVSDPVTGQGGSDISLYTDEHKFVSVMLNQTESATIAGLQFMPPVGYTPWINPPPVVSNAFATLGLSSNSLIIDGTVQANGSNFPPVLNEVSTSTAFIFDPFTTKYLDNFYGAQARVNIFDIPKVVHLVLNVSFVGSPVLMNYPTNRTDFTLVRGVQNTIEFFVRDVDRQIVTGPLANATLSINIVDTNTNKLLLKRDLYSVNAATSLYGVTTQPSEVLNWATGPLRYSVQVTRADGTTNMLWTDRNYSPYGTCTMIDGPLPNPIEPATLDPSTFVIRDGYRYSSPLAGAASKGYPDGLQSFSFYTTNFTGNVIIQGSLVDQPSSDAQNWFDVTSENFVMANGVTATNVEGNFVWVRVAVPIIPYITIPGSSTMAVNGTMDKILYTN